MQLLKLLKKYVVDSQIYVSAMGTLFTVFFMQEQKVFRLPTVLLIFITYFSGYLYTKYQNHRLFHKVLVFNAVCGVFSLILIILNHNEIRILKWLIIVVLGLLYNSFFLEKFIRKIPLLKVFYVGLTWALINSWLILPQFHLSIFLISLFFITALVLPFDIRDMKVDDVVTFPILIGVQKTKYLAYLLVFISLIISLIYLNITFAAAFFLTSVFAFVLIYFSDETNNDSYFSFWIESLSALPFLIVTLLAY